ncbi:hypothetical protein [Amycolatopsis sp. EV170708-02-1]|uniref:hypothetical protein n=1 Tax=Amycolatopsis sp. EV170708-02-1 TaxID=2919322 RepID=UPI001F0C2C03|nr:hypothetical protein [Amycolatopsis sp. EV170708-02-1]UMP00141.1 hypothetical protein MJQ72_26970 [Amycolatopsis sp. EV170708-02-1]
MLLLLRRITGPSSGQVLDLGRDRYRPMAGADEFVRVLSCCRKTTMALSGIGDGAGTVSTEDPAATASQACDLDHSSPWQFGGHTADTELVDA